MQMSYAHPSTAANSGRKVVSAPTQNIAGETAIGQLLAEEESARAKTASKKAKRQRQQQKKRTQSSLSKTRLANQTVQPESTDHYSTSDTLPSSDTGSSQADSETCQSSSPSLPGSRQTGSSTDSFLPKSAHMTVPSDAVQFSDHCANTKLTVSASACMPSMSEASPDQLAPEVLDATAPQGCSEPPDSQKHPSQPHQYTACLHSLAQTDPHLYDGVCIPQPHAINSQRRPTGLQEALTSHQAESSGKQVSAAADTHAIDTAYQAAGFPDIAAPKPKRAEHFLGSIFCCPLTKVILCLAACMLPTCSILQHTSQTCFERVVQEVSKSCRLMCPRSQ